MSNLEVLAGPYELFHETKKTERVTVAIMGNNEVTWRYYKGNAISKRDN